MAAAEERRKVFDTVGLKRLIAKVKKADEQLSSMIQDAAEVHHDESLDGHGTEENPLSVVVDDGLDNSSERPVQNQVVTDALSGKQDQLTEMTDQEVDDLVNSL